MHKAVAVACIVLTLGAQAWVIFPPGGRSRDRHWPFLNYPMYSAAHHRGDSVVIDELRAVPCDLPDSALPIPASALHIELGRYWGMLYRLTRSPKPEALLDTLGRLTRSATSTDVCALEVWRQVLVLEQRGIRLEDHPWVKFRKWRIDPDSSRRTLAPSRR